MRFAVALVAGLSSPTWLAAMSAARDDESGVLVLSQSRSAARELTETLIVNPYDLEEASSALATALGLPREEQRSCGRVTLVLSRVRDAPVHDCAKRRRLERLLEAQVLDLV
jgi:trehalose-6-phosphate synthase